jgi:hypothetical protein
MKVLLYEADPPFALVNEKEPACPFALEGVDNLELSGNAGDRLCPSFNQGFGHRVMLLVSQTIQPRSSTGRAGIYSCHRQAVRRIAPNARNRKTVP